MDDAELGAVVHARVRAAPAARHDAPPRDVTKPSEIGSFVAGDGAPVAGARRARARRGARRATSARCVATTISTVVSAAARAERALSDPRGLCHEECT